MMKKFNIGMVLGKFYPPHKGHLHLIDTAASQCETVYVLCCSIKSEKIPGFLRWSWLTGIYKEQPNVKIIHVTDENPQYPEEHEQFWSIWYKTVYENVPKELDVIFTSEDYGDPFAEVLGCKHVLVDKERITIPISGTLVREDAFKHWEMIPDVVKPFFTKKVVFVGPESTGKTTLSEKMANFFDSDLVVEYGRTYTDGMEDLTQLKIADFERIAFGHVLEIAKKNRASKFQFIDTEAITTKIFGQLYLGDSYQSNDIEKMIKTQHFDVWFLMDIDIPYVQDGNRLPESNRIKHMEMLKAELEKQNIKYILLSGNFEQRYENAKNELMKLLN